MTETVGTRREYESRICERLAAAQPVPFRGVSIDGRHPEIGRCHENVDRWIQANRQCTALRGWVVYASYGEGMLGVTAHSVVRDADGQLFDITPVSDERVRQGMLFVPHEGDDASFDTLRAGSGLSFTCPPGLLDNIQASLLGDQGNPFKDLDDLK